MTQPTPDNNESVTTRNSRENMERLMTEMIEYPERRPALEKTLDTIFGQDKVIFVLDMSGFSRTTQRLGIVSFLLMIHQMKLLAAPCIEAERGLVLKAEADNLFALFDTVDDAVRAGREIIQRLNAANMVLPEGRKLYVSIGIGYGNVLNIEDRDLWGDEVNLASKLGEDIGQIGEILLTAEARARMQDPGVMLQEENISVSGLMLTYYQVLSA